jgi:hypothetical protein
MLTKVGIFVGGTSLGMLGMHLYHKSLNREVPIQIQQRVDNIPNHVNVRESMTNIPLKWEGVSVPGNLISLIYYA